jgi:hypothetical protein
MPALAARVARAVTASPGPGRAQHPQQDGDGPRVVEAGVAGGVAGQQGDDRVAGSTSHVREPCRSRWTGVRSSLFRPCVEAKQASGA